MTSEADAFGHALFLNRRKELNRSAKSSKSSLVWMASVVYIRCILAMEHARRMTKISVSLVR